MKEHPFFVPSFPSTGEFHGTVVEVCGSVAGACGAVAGGRGAVAGVCRSVAGVCGGVAGLCGAVVEVRGRTSELRYTAIGPDGAPLPVGERRFQVRERGSPVAERFAEVRGRLAELPGPGVEAGGRMVEGGVPDESPESRRFSLADTEQKPIIGAVGPECQPSESRAATLEHLAGLIDAAERRGGSDAPAASGGGQREVSTDWPEPAAFLARGVLHEWCGVDDGGEEAGDAPAGRRRGSDDRFAPLMAFVHLARKSASDSPGALPGVPGALPGVVWIGRRVHPYLRALIRVGADGQCDRTVLDRSLLVDPRSESERLWALELCLRSEAVSTVIADGSGFGLRELRRLQLAAEAGGGLVLLARSARDLARPTCAATTWRVRHVRTDGAQPRVRVELVRCKGVQRWSARNAVSNAFHLEWNRETGSLRVPAELSDRSPATEGAIVGSSERQLPPHRAAAG